MKSIKKYIGIIVLIGITLQIASYSYAQVGPGPYEQLPEFKTNRLFFGGKYNPHEVFGKFRPPPPADGSRYYDEEWRFGRIVLFDKTQIDGVYLKYDLKYHTIEIKVELDDDPQYINRRMIKAFEWIDPAVNRVRLFFNPRLLVKSAKKIENDGFLELIDNGEVSLYQQRRAILQDKRGYVPGMSVGTAGKEWEHNAEFFILYKRELYALPIAKKKVQELIQDLSLDTESCSKAKGDNFEQVQELVNCLNKNK